MIKAALKEHVINNLPGKVIIGKKRNLNSKLLSDWIYREARSEDKAFIEQFKNTQMLIHYLDLKYCMK